MCFIRDIQTNIITTPTPPSPIFQSQDDPWLLRSPTTKEYDLLDVDGEWSIWLGRIDKSRLEYTCATCNDNADCNLNGVCNGEGRCGCNSVAGAKYLGTHCEVKLEDDACGTIVTENNNIVFSIQYFSSPDGTGQPHTLFKTYNRPIYTHVQGMPGFEESDIYWLVFTGRKWFGVKLNLLEMNVTFEVFLELSKHFHGECFTIIVFHSFVQMDNSRNELERNLRPAFWSNVYSSSTLYVSDSTTRDSPVGVDFYWIGERGNQFGPFGALYPLQKYNQTGRGIWRCSGPPTPGSRWNATT